MKFAPLLLLLCCVNAQASQWIVEFKESPSAQVLKQLQKKHKIERFDNFENDYFKRAFLVDTELSATQLKAQLDPVIPVNMVEGITQVQALSIEPSDSLERHYVNDQLFRYQWGMVSQGQRVRRDKDDINYVMLQDPAAASSATTPDWLNILGEHAQNLPPEVLVQLLSQNTSTNVVARSDVNYVGFLEAIKGRETARDIVVAVIDSGVDVGHPDLKNVILRNPQECNEDGSINYETRDDLDGNDVPGDCIGWNFTVHKNDPRAKLPSDSLGHGTHVAGIIAAQADNATGVSGFGHNIKILPIKVLNEDETSAEARQIALTDRIARGILYAIKRQADVINLSLGWLRQADTNYLREAVNAALARGIPVIAAAGNNGARARLFPCSYPGVICVGATRIDGAIADFSNHGGSVDILAPGDSILSTWPVTRIPMVFSVHGYEIQSGTSQATPFVSALAAQLRAYHPEARLNEIQARLMLGANEDILKANPKLALSGRTDMAKSLLVEEQSVVRPMFKSLDEISYKLADRRFRFPLPIMNYWRESGEVKVHVAMTSAAVRLARQDFTIEQIAQGRSVILPIEGELSDLSLDHAVAIEVTIDLNGQKKTYHHSVNFVRLLIDDPEVDERLVEFKDGVKPLALVQEGKISTLITTIESFYGTSDNEWFLRRNDEAGVELTFFSPSQDKIVEGATFMLNGAKRLLGLLKMDFNRDGLDDRLIRSTVVDAEGNENAIVYSFRAQDGSNLFGEYSDWKFVPDVAVANDTLAFVSGELPGVGTVPVPIFVAQGTLPEAQQPTGFFDTRDEATRNRIYALVPKIVNGKVELTTVALDTLDMMKQWREKLQLPWNEPLKILTILAPSVQEHRDGTIRVLINGGHASRRLDAVIKISSPTSIEVEAVDLKGIRPENQTPVRVANLDEERFSRHERTGFVGFYDGKRARMSVVGSEMSSLPYSLKDEFDYYSGHVASFVAKGQLTSVYTSSNRLVMINNQNGIEQVLERPLERFDFIPGEIFNELFYPIARQSEDGSLIPSLYVNASDIHSNSVHIIEARDGGFVASMEQSLLLPPNCKALNPIILPGEKKHRTTLLCLENSRGFVFKFVR